MSTSGSAAGRVIDIYQRHADAWSRDRGARLPEKAWLDRFLSLLPDGAAVLDLGCGPGVPIARYLVENGCRVTGVDAAGALMFTSGPAAGERIGSYRGEPLYHASLDTDEYRRLLHDNGFGVVDHVAEDPNCGLHTVWLANLTA